MKSRVQHHIACAEALVQTAYSLDIKLHGLQHGMSMLTDNVFSVPDVRCVFLQETVIWLGTTLS